MRITAYRLIMAATAALAAGVLAASCSKEPVAGNDGGGGSDGGRTISVSFEGSTKTELGDKQDDGTIPASFTASDVILVSNGSALEDCKVVIGDDGDASITTTLKGELNAVYPPEAAVYLGYNITGFKVSDSQSGRFEDAHICTATIAEGDTEAHFSNETAILKFYVDKSIGVTSIKVTSAGADIATGSKTITVTAPRGKTLADVTDDPQKRICYVAVLPGVNANQLTFTTKTTTQPTLPKTPSDGVALTASKFYKAFIPYYITIGSQKWGYCNVGAFLPEEAGWYFSWGNIDGYVLDGSTWKKAPGRTEIRSEGFSGYNKSPYNSSAGRLLTTDIPVNAQYDAAYVNWGSSWRIASNAEFGTLCADCGGSGTMTPGGTVDTVNKDIYSCTNYYGVEGALFCDGTNNLFLPAVGVGQNNKISIGTDSNIKTGLYLSSTTWVGANPAYSGFLRLNFTVPGSVSNSSGSNRGDGFPIRPILNDAWWYEDLDDGGTI